MTISIIGTGNVAYHMVRALGRQVGVEIVAICGTTAAKAKAIRTQVSTLCTSDISVLPTCDLVLICVPDKIIAEVSQQLEATTHLTDSIIAHTSGSIPSDVLAGHKNFGVFYPLQTFTAGIRMGYKTIPFCITANTPTTKKHLTDLAHKVSSDIRLLTDEQRASVHLSAVVVNNLTNHLIHLATHRLEQQQVESDILYPLIAETVSKLAKVGPLEAQTGPARRGDEATMSQHIRRLADSPQLRDIYELITKSIQQTYKYES